MATKTSKARDRAIARTVEAAELMAAAPLSALPSPAPYTIVNAISASGRCLEGGTTNRKNCCWHSRQQAECGDIQEQVSGYAPVLIQHRGVLFTGSEFRI